MTWLGKLSKKWSAVLLTFGLLALFAAIILGCALGRNQGKASPRSDVPQQNDVQRERYPETQEEYDFFDSLCRADTINYFYGKYGLDLGPAPDGWEQSVDGVTPQQYLERQTLHTWRRFYVIMELAAEYRIPAPESWGEMRSDWEAYNEQRVKTCEAGGVLYGPTTLDFYQFFLYTFGHIEDEVREELYEKRLNPTEQELRSCYESMDKTLFRGLLTADVTIYRAVPSEMDTGAAVRALNALQSDLELGIRPEPGVLSEEYGHPLTAESLSIRSNYLSKDDTFGQSLCGELYGRKTGSLFIMTCQDVLSLCLVTSLDDASDSSFEANREIVRSYYFRDAYEAFIEGLIGQ